MQEIYSWFNSAENSWILHVFLIVFLTASLNFFLRSGLKRATLHFAKTSNPWDDALLDAAKRPLLLGSWALGLSFALDVVGTVSENAIFQQISLFRRILIILFLMQFLVQLIKNLEATYVEKEHLSTNLDETSIRVIARLLRLSVLITGVLVILQTFGISVSGVVAFGGIGGIAVGFAAKDLLANFFGGLMVYLDRPFTVGDWVRSPDRNIEGTVEEIGWRLTRIRTFDKRPLYVPNAAFTSIAVENPSRMLNRRINETFGLRYSDASKIKVIVADVKQMLLEHPEIDHDATLIVNFNALAASSLDFFIYTFTKTTEWVYFHEVKQDVLLKVIDIIHAHNADIAFPTRTLEGLTVVANSDEPST